MTKINRREVPWEDVRFLPCSTCEWLPDPLVPWTRASAGPITGPAPMYLPSPGTTSWCEGLGGGEHCVLLLWISSFIYFQIMPCGGLTLAGQQLLTRPALSLPSAAAQGRERTSDERLMGWGKDREITQQLPSWEKQTSLGEVSLIYYQSHQSRILRNKTKS